MPRTWIDLTDDTKAQWEALAETDKLSLSEWIERAVLDSLTQPPDPEPPSPAIVEDGIADHLLGRLDPVQAQMIVTVARDRGYRPYQFFLSAIRQTVDRGESVIRAVPGIDLERPAASAPNALSPVRCEWCATAFTPLRPGQTFCPDPEDGTPGCGRQAMLAAIQRRRAAVRPATEQYAPRQTDTRALAAAHNRRG